jgi:fructose-1,6-bisphosphatase I
MAFIVEQAGGKASDGFNRIMEYNPQNFMKEFLFCGSYNMGESRRIYA